MNRRGLPLEKPATANVDERVARQWNCTQEKPEMKLIESTPAPLQQAVFAVDVGKDELHLYSELGGEVIRETFGNRTPSIEKALDRLVERHQVLAHNPVLVVEATGSYHESILRVARKRGFETAWVSGEKVSNMRIIEFGDQGKTDKRDPQVIYRVAKLGYVMKRRVFEERYQLLREWHHIYASAEDDQKSTKVTLHHELKKIFPDFDFKAEWLYTRSGKALVDLYGANPHRIRAARSPSFRARLKKHARRIQSGSIDRLRATAKSSLRSGPSKAHAEVLEVRIRQLYNDFETTEARKAEARAAMEELYDDIRELDDCHLPEPVRGVVTKFHLARLVAEIGPFADFKSWRQLYRFAGLNLRERRSGSYRGKTKITKKGRWLLRRVLTHIALSLVKRDRLFGTYYHHKRDVEKMHGAKAMVSVGRKVLKMIFGWYQSRKPFDANRVFTCVSQYQLAA